MVRVVADSNIYISALNFGGRPDEVLALARRSVISLFISQHILQEIDGVLRSKFGWPARHARAALTLIRAYAAKVDPQERISVISRDDADNRVIECALTAQAEVIVSGDSRLLDLRSFRGVRILTPTQFLAEIKV